jgi:hypothetical protein
VKLLRYVYLSFILWCYIDRPFTWSIVHFPNIENLSFQF